MINTLRQYHLGCGERLQAFYTLASKISSEHQQRIARLKGKSSDTQRREQH